MSYFFSARDIRFSQYNVDAKALLGLVGENVDLWSDYNQDLYIIATIRAMYTR
jgi:hypothetical protein